MFCQFFGRGVVEGANHNAIDKLADHAAKVCHAFARAKADVAAQEHGAAAQLDHAGFETAAGAQRRLFENQPHHAARAAAARASLAGTWFSDLAVIAKMRSISADFRSATVSRCLMEEYRFCVSFRNRARQFSDFGIASPTCQAVAVTLLPP